MGHHCAKSSTLVYFISTVTLLGPIFSLVYILGDGNSEKRRDLSKSPKLGSNWIDIWTQVYPPYHIGMVTWVVRYITCVHRPRLWYRGWYGGKNNLQNQMDTGSNMDTITYKLWKHYLTSLNLVFFICKMRMIIISILTYYMKKRKICECQIIWNLEGLLSSFSFLCKTELGGVSLALWKQGELWKHEAGKYWLIPGEREGLPRKWYFSWVSEDVRKLD